MGTTTTTTGGKTAKARKKAAVPAVSTKKPNANKGSVFQQLGNDRKHQHRVETKKQQEPQPERHHDTTKSSSGTITTNTTGSNISSRRGSKNNTTATRRRKSSSSSDPSAQYLPNPKSAPIVRAAQRFFASRLPAGRETFAIHQNGPKVGWRTVSKLPVRRQPPQPTTTTSKSSRQKRSKQRRVVIGLFQPKSHTVLAASSSKNNNNANDGDYPAHHPSINRAMSTVALACQEMGIDIFDEFHDPTTTTTSNGYLRFVAMNVERSTGKVQLTLVWNDAPYPEPLAVSLTSLSSSKKKRQRQQRQKQQQQQQAQELVNNNSRSITGKAQLERLLSHLLKQPTTTTTNNEPTSSSSGGQQQQHFWHSIWVHYNSTWKHSNAIFDIHASSPNAAWYHVCGPPTVPEQLLLLQQQRQPSQHGSGCVPTTTPTLHFGPRVFRQANLDAFAYIIQAIRQRIQRLASASATTTRTENIGVVELYGGVGTIGLHLLDLPTVASLVCSDENPHNQDCFRKGLDSVAGVTSATSTTATGNAAAVDNNKNNNDKKAIYIPKSASDMVTDPQHARVFRDSCQVLIVDPPRKGLDDAVLDFLVGRGKNNNSNNNKRKRNDNGKKSNNNNNNKHHHEIQLLIYVSCGFDAFQRDYGRLVVDGNFKLEHAEGHILFPGSNAIETLAFFTPN